VRIGLRYGFILFIMSEVMFFSAWFWTFFKHRCIRWGRKVPWVDGVWPPEGIVTFDPWHLPLINTLILLLSGCAVTWAHHALVHENNRKRPDQRPDPSASCLGVCSPSSRPMNTATPPLALPETSMARPSSWRPASTASMSSSARSS
jgi:hypothetical protein